MLARTIRFPVDLHGTKDILTRRNAIKTLYNKLQIFVIQLCSASTEGLTATCAVAFVLATRPENNECVEEKARPKKTSLNYTAGAVK